MRMRMVIVLGILVFLFYGFAAEKEESITEGLANGEFTTRLNGFDIFYAVYGHGPILMAMPNSWGLSHQGLRALYRPLEKHLTMIYFDPRGMGKSEAIRTDSDMSMAAVRADLDALRHHLGLNKVNVIGWSNGGMNLLLYAAEHPEALSSAIIVHSIDYFSKEDMEYMVQKHPEMFKKYMQFVEEMSKAEVTNEERQARYEYFFMNDYMPLLFSDPESGRAKIKELYKDTELSWKHSMYSDTVDSPKYDARDKLSKITVPTLVLAGAHDMIPPARIEDLHKGLPNSTFVIFENSGHFSQIEEPEKFKKVILEFIKHLER